MDFDDEFDFSGGDHIDLTPVIDVLFLLLIFFIMTTTFAKPVVSVLLPEAGSASGEKQREEMKIVIDGEGNIFYQGEAVAAEEVAGLMEREKKLPINFHVDKKAPFEAVMLVLDQARQHDRNDFVFSTEKEKDGRTSP